MGAILTLSFRPLLWPRPCRPEHPDHQPGRHTATAPDDGFSLIELVVVIAVMAVLSVGAVLATGARPGPGDAQRFQLAFEQARDLAVLSGRTRGLAVTPAGLQRALPDQGGWQTVGQVQRWRSRPTLTVPDRLDTRSRAPQLIFLPDGRSSAFALVFRGGARCESDGWTGLICTSG